MLTAALEHEAWKMDWAKRGAEEYLLLLTGGLNVLGVSFCAGLDEDHPLLHVLLIVDDEPRWQITVRAIPLALLEGRDQELDAARFARELAQWL